ncbi:16S rRNA (cytosine(1402)-N(4))-methyltransferase RsmH [Roseovarius pelagicus]|uniref:Ribosomal RNA small subunit methyltransferase H n=1 Tax=Roseovarius pelagicus TaxID=2980108 RepID=A0ABY6DGU8_9RHOB|nr:16S rRNA (cytosine(1402)-N(4))-methyltransferase RsmH [Roseovarius pelagicus]UXX84193.1 16S rRNA (cytosine(1402)-N(4))-methyltransferase RsmH [Roseovarius pelagicus]
MGSDAANSPHVPVLITPLIAACAPIAGHWIDGTLGAGGYARALLDAGADQVTGVDRDPMAIEMAAEWADAYGARMTVVQAQFSQMDQVADAADGVVLDLGVSSMQLDQARRGFSFMRDGPLDMRMSQSGLTAADLVNSVDEGELADILFLYGEERASRRIARAIVRKRAEVPIVSTLQLAEIIEGCLPRAKPGQAHPATRSFQAIRIAVNDEYGELIGGLEAAERVLRPGGHLAVVTFHSIEDRMVKRFFQSRAGGGGGSRHAPELESFAPQFIQASRKAISADEAELASNPRARSARLRVGMRTDAPPGVTDRKALGMPLLKGDY